MEETAPTKPYFREEDMSKVVIGYLFLMASGIIYFITEQFWKHESSNDYLSVFTVHYFVAIVFLVMLLYSGEYGIIRSWREKYIHKTVILLQLFLISAYALNRTLPVFEESTTWLCVYLITASIVMLSYRYYERLPAWVNRIQHVLLGGAIALYFYLAVFVAPFYPVGTVGVILLGVGAHIFVPVTLIIGCAFLLYYSGRGAIHAWYWAGMGFLTVIIFVAGFVLVWNNRVLTIERTSNQAVMYPDVELPAWVNVASEIPNDWLTECIMKSEMVYTVPTRYNGWNFMPLRSNWDETRKHDPLVFLASLVNTCTLPDDERIAILRSLSDTRHQSNERLWAGTNLTTSYIITDVDLYPELRIAYAEKYLNVRNQKIQSSRWGNTEEAIYTFQLPEGSVVTSLSLWINGKEEKAILTSKQKAAKAYTTIVGVEQRDPSVIHWQEGNTVTVRVFPCTPSEERRFKIGITSPLSECDGQLVFRNLMFHGPDASDAKETYRIRFIGSAKEIEMPSDFIKDKKGDYISEQKYNPDFELTFKAHALKPNQFSFDGYHYSIAPYQPEHQPAAFNKIYLDINNSWSNKDLSQLESLMINYSIYAFVDSEFIRITADNWALLTDDQLKRNFSIFPFHQIRDTAHSLIVTKGKQLSPHLSDFKESKFAQGVSDFFASREKVNVYNLEGESSTYVRSLRELRGLEFAHGDVAHLKELLQNKQFPVTTESNERVVLHDAGLVITKLKDDQNRVMIDNAPDHLARLFAYNNIMRQVGNHYFENNFINEQLVNEASSAYVVSPVSSLIVLETKEDYERFGITDKENSLKNASKQSSGAVPEPHEWALIILFLLLVLYTTRKKSKLRETHE